MKKSFIKVSDSAILTAYLMLVLVMVRLAVLGCVRNGDDIRYCLSDIFCYVEHYTKYSLYPLIQLLLIIFLKGQFRAAVIIRYEKAWRLVFTVVKKVAGLALAASVYQTLVTIVLGMRFAVYGCTWDTGLGLPFRLVGAVLTEMPSTEYVILIYMCSVFMTVLVSGMLIAACWWLTQTPVTGYFCLIGLMVFESASSRLPGLFFKALDMEPVNVFLRGLQMQTFTIYPICLSAALFAAGAVIVKKRDFIRII